MNEIKKFFFTKILIMAFLITVISEIIGYFFTCLIFLKVINQIGILYSFPICFIINILGIHKYYKQKLIELYLNYKDDYED